MMIRSTYLLCTLATTAAFFGMTTATLAGPTPTPATATPATATPTPATPTPVPDTCVSNNPPATINTIGKGQSPSVNPLIAHEITGNIIDPGSYGPTAHRIQVCAGTSVTAVVTDGSGGTTTSTSSTGLFCNLGGCSGVVNVKQSYKSTSTGSSDSDSITFLPN
jgi:hypothetical protein